MIGIRYALRQLRCSPVFSLIVIRTVALAAGTNTRIFTLVDGVPVKSLPIAGNSLTTLGMALDDMNGHARLVAQQSRIVALRFFSRLSIEETAALPDLSPVTIKRHWATARLWLYRERRRESHA